MCIRRRGGLLIYQDAEDENNVKTGSVRVETDADEASCLTSVLSKTARVQEASAYARTHQHVPYPQNQVRAMLKTSLPSRRYLAVTVMLSSKAQ